MHIRDFFAPKSELIWLLLVANGCYSPVQMQVSVMTKGQCIKVFTKDIWITCLTQDMVLIKECYPCA